MYVLEIILIWIIPVSHTYSCVSLHAFLYRSYVSISLICVHISILVSRTSYAALTCAPISYAALICAPTSYVALICVLIRILISLIRPYKYCCTTSILCGAHVCPYTHSYIAHTCPYTYSCTTYHHLMWRSYVSSHVFSFHVHPYGAGPEHWQHLLLQRRRRDHVGGSPPFLLPYPLPPSLSPSLSFSLSLSFPLPLARSLARSLIRPSRMHLSKHIHTHTANIYLICINMYMYVCVCVYTYTYIYILWCMHVYTRTRQTYIYNIQTESTNQYYNA